VVGGMDQYWICDRFPVRIFDISIEQFIPGRLLLPGNTNTYHPNPDLARNDGFGGSAGRNTNSVRRDGWS